MTRICSKCKEEKEDCEFHRSKKHKSGLQYHCKECRREHNILNYVPDTWHNFHIKRKYGISPSEFKEMLSKQNGLCAICEEPPTIKRLCVDHCHATNKVRGLLCNRCNRSLGQFKDDIELMYKAISYLKCHREV